MRKYVEVVSHCSAEGVLTPLTIIWDDGVRYHIDKVLGVRQAQARRTGGAGLRFTIRVGSRQTYLFYDKRLSSWFVEAKVPAVA